MIKKIMAVAVLVSLFALSAGVTGPVNTKKVAKKNDAPKDVKAVTFTGTMGTTFDKSANGYGWYQGYNRKIQTNMDPVTGPMVGSIYRQLHATAGSGTIGGMCGAWDTAFSGFAQTVYSVSNYQGSPYGSGNPGGRYPYSSEFINGYFFGLFNDYNLPVGSTDSQAMFTVADATFGWDISFWSAPKRIEATEGGATMPGAWTGIGDVTYDPATGYYYWTSNWNYDLALIDDSEAGMVVGRTMTPNDPDSWEWTDYSELYFDATDDANTIRQLGNIDVAYCKDIYGNGTGYGIALTMFNDVTYEMQDGDGNSLDVTDHPRLGYIYTTNWGADSGTGDFKPNWITPNGEGNNFFGADIYKLFPFYGEEAEVDSVTTATLNWPYLTWNISSVATEENYVHVIVKAVGASTDEGDAYWWFTHNGSAIAGYYHILGHITESGVNWVSVDFIANFMGIDDDEMEWQYSNNHDLAIGYAGNGVVYASWGDRPETRWTVNPNTAPEKLYIDDYFFTYSPDYGKTWDINKTVDFDGIPLQYAANVTKTSTLQDEGWIISSHGWNEAPNMKVYAVCQYYDPTNPLEPPNNDYYDYQQFLKVWQVTGTPTGIETEEVSMVKDFTLFQNYPNPFNPVTEIRFALENDSDVKLAVYNTKGELVSNLKSEKMVKGNHSVSFDASALNSGVYFYKLSVGARSEVKKMVLTK